MSWGSTSRTCQAPTQPATSTFAWAPTVLLAAHITDLTAADVINVRPTRVLLVTDNHVAYLRARHLRRHSIYKAKWLVPISEMQNLAGGAGWGPGS